MDASAFTVLEHHLPERIGLPLSEIVVRRKQMDQGTDWIRQGRWIKYSEGGLRKLQGQVGVAEINPLPAPPEERQGAVTRMNFPNQTLIEVQEFDTGKIWLVRIKPDWRDKLRVKWPVKFRTNGEPVGIGLRPRPKFLPA